MDDYRGKSPDFAVKNTNQTSRNEKLPFNIFTKYFQQKLFDL
jgi:hypothetical protein